MSTEEASFEERIEAIYEQYRHGELEDRLDDVAEVMEQTVLQRILAEKFLQTEIEIEPEVKAEVREAKRCLEEERYDELTAMIDDLEAQVNDEKRRMKNQIDDTRYDMRDTVGGMQRLNQRVDRVSEVKLEAIYELLDDWDWKRNIYRDEEAEMEDLKENAAEYGAELRQFFEESRDAIFGPYEGTPLEPIVDDLLSDDRLTLDDLSDEQREGLADSDLAPYVGLSIS